MNSLKRVQVLVATMRQTNFSKFHEMNIQTDVVFANQTDVEKKEETRINDCVVKMISTLTRGVGLNRNIAIENSDGDILLIADDDIKYVNDYEKIVLDAFETIEEADVLIFNIDTIGIDMHRRINSKVHRVRFYNAFNYGAVRIAIKRKCVIDNNLRFNLDFGGGTKYSAGEDSLFIKDMLRSGLKIYAVPIKLADVEQKVSSWFSGYNDKYFYDKGALFTAMFGNFALPFAFQDLIRHWKIYKESGKNFFEVSRLLKLGMKGYKYRIPFGERDEH